MTVVDRPFDLEDLLGTPDDGNRHEVLDGALVVSPPPGTAHQAVVLELAVLLRSASRHLGLRTFVAPVAWRIGPGQVPEPDLMVVAPEAVAPQAIQRPPLLVVEILSPSGRDRDLFEKRRIYARGGAAIYWIVDPAEPSLTVLRLGGTITKRRPEWWASPRMSVRIRLRSESSQLTSCGRPRESLSWRTWPSVPCCRAADLAGACSAGCGSA